MRGTLERPKGITTRARSLRQSTTDVERRLWHKLRDRRLGGYKFVRQLPVGPFFADFGCRESKLLIEVDGSQHADSLRDVSRDNFLVAEGYRVLRFWNAEVLKNMTGVCETIVAALENRLEPYDRHKVGTRQQD